MKTKTKKLLSLFLAAVLLLCAVPLAAPTASAKKSGIYTYTVKNKQATITYCNSTVKGTLNIPSKLGGYPVTAIGDEAFSGCFELKSVKIPSSVKKIGEAAFFTCSSLSSVTLPKNLESIGDGAFYSTALKSLTLPNSVKKIGASAFALTKIKTLKLGSGLKTIGDSAFSTCNNLKSAVIPKNVSKIGAGVFESCGSLNSLSVASGNKTYSSKNNCIIKTKTKELVSGCNGSVIPTDKSVTKIAESAFYGAKGLKKIVIPKSVTRIGDFAFYDCEKLKTISLPDSLTFIGNSAFGNTAYERNSTDAGENVLYIGKYLVDADFSEFYGDYEIKSGTTLIACFVFRFAQGLRNITIPESVRYIGEGAFSSCALLESVNIPKNVKSIGTGAFEGCSSMKTMTVDPNNKVYRSAGNCIITNKSKKLISGCKNSKIPADGSVKSIGECAFFGCRELKSITIPKSVTEIGAQAFSNCIGLKSLSIPGNVKTIGYGAFICCEGIKKLTFENGLTKIGDEAFYLCSSLTSVKIPNSVKSIGSAAFMFCDKLKSVSIGKNVTSIGAEAFKACPSLRSVTVPKNVKSIGKNAFGYVFNENVIDYTAAPGFKIKGAKGSAAQKYAKSNGFKFTAV